MRWFIRQLLNALLRPMYARWRAEQRCGNTAPALRFEQLFFVLLNSCDPYPFCIEVDVCGLWILDEPSECDDHFESAGDRFTCDRCGGDGMIDYLDGDGSDWGEDSPSEENHPIPCRACNGTGQIDGGHAA